MHLSVKDRGREEGGPWNEGTGKFRHQARKSVRQPSQVKG